MLRPVLAPETKSAKEIEEYKRKIDEDVKWLREQLDVLQEKFTPYLKLEAMK